MPGVDLLISHTKCSQGSSFWQKTLENSTAHCLKLSSCPARLIMLRFSKSVIRIKDFKPQNAGQELQAFASTARLDAETQWDSKLRKEEVTQFEQVDLASKWCPSGSSNRASAAWCSHWPARSGTGRPCQSQCFAQPPTCRCQKMTWRRFAHWCLPSTCTCGAASSWLWSYHRPQTLLPPGRSPCRRSCIRSGASPFPGESEACRASWLLDGCTLEWSSCARPGQAFCPRQAIRMQVLQLHHLVEHTLGVMMVSARNE